jgi:arsenate reductase (thioredoxin)
MEAEVGKRQPILGVLFLCTQNSARSQMAEGLLKHLSDGSIDVQSAGSVATELRPEAVQVMEEIGIDIQSQLSKTLDKFVEERFDYVITVCDQANESCPIFPNARNRWHWSIKDPASVMTTESDRISAFRNARDDLRSRIEEQLLPQLIG